MPTTPFFPAWRARLGPLKHRVEQVRRQSLPQLDRLFGPLLPPALLAQADEGPNSREHIYSVRRTFFGFLHQALNPACPCREVVRQIQALFALAGTRKVSGATGAYSTARGRLPIDTLARLRCAAAARAGKAAELWHGLTVKVIDGTCLSLPDTRENQRAYPQSRKQKRGCGFPLLKVVGIFSLATGALLDYARGNKHQHELSLLQSLMETFKRGDLALADRGFCCYTLLALLWRQNVPGLFRLHHSRKGDWRQGTRLGREDRLLVWRKSRQRPRYLPVAVWRLIAPELTVRVLRFSLRRAGYRTRSITLVTTLVDAELYPARELAELYARRWRIELWLRDIKTSMGMEVLRCESPKMVHKELEMFFIAYNLIRGLMAQASRGYQADLHRLSFKGTVDAVRQFSVAIAQARSQRRRRKLVDRLLEAIAKDPVPERPGRREPRAVKRRPKAFPKLNRPRHLFKDIPHINRNWKNKPRKTRA